MRELRWGLATAAVATLGLCVAAGTAGAQPMVVSPLTPHVALNTSVPPTTAQCQSSFGISCYSPAQLQAAYDLQPLYARGQTGAGRTIAIVDSFGSPTIAHDVAQFDADFGLPAPPSLKIIQPAGQVPPFDPANADMVGWAEETSLDVEYAHAIAPGANILLVETPVAETEGETGFPEIVRAESYVIDHRMADVITQSFGATEDTFKSVDSLLSLRSAFANAALHGAATHQATRSHEQIAREIIPASRRRAFQAGAGIRLDAPTRWNTCPIGVPLRDRHATLQQRPRCRTAGLRTPETPSPNPREV